jgi:hypothetical protein
VVRGVRSGTGVDRFEGKEELTCSGWDINTTLRQIKL